MQILSTFLLIFGDKKELYLHIFTWIVWLYLVMVSFRIEEKIHTKAVSEKSGGEFWKLLCLSRGSKWIVWERKLSGKTGGRRKWSNLHGISTVCEVWQNNNLKSNYSPWKIYLMALRRFYLIRPLPFIQCYSIGKYWVLKLLTDYYLRDQLAELDYLNLHSRLSPYD